MTTYKCKCGRQVAKSTNADNTGNRDTTGCEGCPYLLPWGPTVWDDTRHAVVTDIKGYECRMSPELSYITELWGRVDDKCTMQINSLDFDFLERVSAWIKEHYPKGELSGGFSRAKMRACEFVAHGRYRMSICCAQNKAGMAAKAALVAAFFDPKSKTRLDIDPAAEKQLILNAIEAGKEAARQDVPKKEIINMDVAYKGPDGRLYRVSAQPDAKGGYYIEYRDPAGSAVYKPLPGHAGGADCTDRADVVEWLGEMAKNLKWTAVEAQPLAAMPAPSAEKPKSPGVWLYGDHRAMRVGVGNDTDRGDSRYYHVLVLNLLADKPCWRKLSGAGNYDYKHLIDADKELRETLPEDAHELTMTEAGRLFTSPATGLFELKPNAIKVWAEIMADKPAASPASVAPQKCRYAGAFVKDGLECLCDPAQRATIAKVKPGDDVPCLTAGPTPDCRAYYAGRIINDEGMDIWKSMNHNSTIQLKEYVAQMDAAETQGSEQAAVATAEMDGNAAICQEEPVLAIKSAESLASAPATDIAAPAFDYTQVDTDTANLLRELESGIAENQKTAVQVALAIGEKLQCGHDYLAKKGYGCYGEWCESLGYNRTQAKRLTDLHNFVCNTMLQTERDAIEALPLTVAYQVANPNMPEEVKEAARNGDISTLKELEALRAQLKATEVAKAEAEREKREALAWKQHAEGQAEDAKAAIHAAQQTAQEAQRQARQAEAKVEHQESMLAELQDRLDEATTQLRNPPLEATMVDKDELERRAQELADQKIAEALSDQERQPLCDLVITLNNAIKSAWSLSGIEDRDPESEDDDTSLEVLYETLYYLTDWVEERLAPDVYEQEEAIAT